jgi:stage II sporulation protein R
VKTASDIGVKNTGMTGAGRAGPSRDLVRRRLGQAFLALLTLVLGLAAWSGWRLRADAAYNTHNLIRLHVVANSDQPKDQQVKLEVRDAILEASGDLFGAHAGPFAEKTPDSAVLAIKGNLPLFQRVAENVLAASGYDYSVKVEYGAFAFPERTYGPLVLPQGKYQALRVVLGSGQGANWWCILFPPLCYLDVVGGRREAEWTIAPDGTMTVASRANSGARAGAAGEKLPGAGAAETTGRAPARVVSLNALTDVQLRELEGLLQQALDKVADGRGTTDAAVSGRAATTPANGMATDGGVRVIISDVPSNPDANLVILVADTGTARTEVRFYVFDRLRDLLRSLAIAAPWFVSSSSADGSAGVGPER